MDTEKLSDTQCAVAPCPVVHALKHVGDSWSMLILRDAGAGLARFDQFRTSLGIAPNILTARLKALTEAGMLAKRRYSERPPRDEYVLTEAGRDFLPVLHVLGEWGRRHHGERGGPHLIDTATGAAVYPQVVDRETGTPIERIAVRIATPEEAEGKRAKRVWRLD